MAGSGGSDDFRGLRLAIHKQLIREIVGDAQQQEDGSRRLGLFEGMLAVTGLILSLLCNTDDFAKMSQPATARHGG